MNVKKLWIAVLVGMLLVLSLAGEAGARESAAVSAWKYVTIPAGHFHPIQDGYDWYNAGLSIRVSSGTGTFTAPVVFPGFGSVTVKKVILFTYDQNGTDDVSVSLYKTRPDSGTEVRIARAESSGSAPGVRAFSNATIMGATVYRSRGTYLWLNIPSSSNLEVYAVKIAYVD